MRAVEAKRDIIQLLHGIESNFRLIDNHIFKKQGTSKESMIRLVKSIALFVRAQRGLEWERGMNGRLAWSFY